MRAIPIIFVLPELIEGSSGPSHSMPPSCETGALYVDPWGRSYMQPLIEYSLQIRIQLRLSNDTRIRISSTKTKINITVAPHNEPPAYSRIQAETMGVNDSTAVRRSRFSKAFAKMSVSIAEPMPVVGHASNGCQTVAELRLTWDTTSEAYDDFEMGKVPIRIDCHLHERTFYGTRSINPRDGTPCGDIRPYNLHRMIQLTTLQAQPADRQNVRLINSSGSTRCHTGTIPIVIKVEEGTVPSFCYSLAERTYALQLKVQLQRWHHHELVLKVPLQICEGMARRKDVEIMAECPASNALLSSEVRKQNSQAGLSGEFEANISQTLPRYSRHTQCLPIVTPT